MNDFNLNIHLFKNQFCMQMIKFKFKPNFSNLGFLE